MTQRFRFNIPDEYALDLSAEAEMEGMVYSGPHGFITIGFENLMDIPINQSMKAFFEGLDAKYEMITEISPVTLSGLPGYCCRYLVGNDHYYTEVNLKINVPDAQIPTDTLSIILRAGSLGELQILESEVDLANLIELC